MPGRSTLALPLLLVALGVGEAGHAASPPGGGTLSLLEVYVNQRPAGGAVPVVEAGDGQLWLRVSDLRAWSVRLAGAPVWRRRGEPFAPIARIPGLSHRVEERRQELWLTVAPGSLEPNRIDGRPQPGTSLSPAGLGGFLNYEMIARAAEGGERVSGVWETGIFHRRGSAVSSFLGEGGGDGRRIVRLETAWTRGDPESMTTWRVGDGVSRAGSWWRAVRFAGVSRQTDFGTRPGFVPFPLPAISGEAALPSVVDLYVDEARRWRREVPPGPFEIDNLPVVNGRGDLQLVVRDLLGRERRISEPYYVSDSLLRPGLSDFSYGVGFVRRGFGLESDAYGPPLATLTHRRGLTRRFTGEVHGEYAEGDGAIGLGGVLLVERAGVFEGSLAAGGAGSAWDGLVGLGFSRQGRRTDFALRARFAGSGFRTPSGSLAGGAGDPRREIQARWSLNLERRGRVSLAVLDRELRDGRGFELASLSYSVRPCAGTALGFTAFSSRDEVTRRGAVLTVTRSLGARTDVSATLSSGGGGSGRGGVTLRRSPPAGRGFGYRLTAESGDAGRVRGALEARLDRAEVAVEADRTASRSAWRASVRGGVAAAGGRLFLSRPIERSFGVVRVGDYPGVRVYHQNRLVARTGPRGRALVPDLLPYQPNLVGVAIEDLPLEAQPDAGEIEVAPPGRAGVVVDFPLRVVRGALLEVRLPGGEHLPLGATVAVEGGTEEFPVGRGGAVYVTGLEGRARLRARWAGGECAFTIEPPAAAGALTRLPPAVCE